MPFGSADQISESERKSNAYRRLLQNLLKKVEKEDGQFSIPLSEIELEVLEKAAKGDI